MRSRLSASLLLVGFVPAVLVAASPPEAVSPGSATGALTADTCPTFSWGQVPGARGYLLVVYRVGEDNRELERVLSRRFSGSVFSWTPSLDSCLGRGIRYGWSVMAEMPEGESEWSPPNLFEVVEGPSATEFEKALSVVRAYLAGRQNKADTRLPPERPEPTRLDPRAPIQPYPRGTAPDLQAGLRAQGVETGVIGESTSPAGSGGMFWGTTWGASGIADATSGWSVGLLGSSDSPSGVGGIFLNSAGGWLLSAETIWGAEGGTEFHSSTS